MTRKLKNRKNHRTEAIVAVSGTAAGAAVGSVAGPVGTVAGAIVGGAIGAAAGLVLERENERAHLHDEQLDEEIGVYDGELGVASPDAPPARIGAFSTGSSGSSRPSVPPAAGPMQEVEG